MIAPLVKRVFKKFLRVNLPSSLSFEDRTKIFDKAHSAVFSSLSDKMLCEVLKESTMALIWLKLEHLPVAKSLTNRLY